MSILSVKVIPKSGRSELKFEGELLKVWLRSTPEDGKANDELVRMLAKRLDIYRAQITIIRGKSTRNKAVDIAGISVEEMKKTLANDKLDKYRWRCPNCNYSKNITKKYHI